MNKKRHFVITSILVLALLIVAVQVLQISDLRQQGSKVVSTLLQSPSDLRQQKSKAVSKPIESPNQTRRNNLPPSDLRQQKSKVVSKPIQSPNQTRRNNLPPSDLREQKSKTVSKPIQSPEQTRGKNRPPSDSRPKKGKETTRKVLPQCIIAGVRKCGTGALWEFLSLHTDVESSSEECHFFDVDTSYKRGLEWYRNKMPATMPHQLTIEKTPNYFHKVEAPERVRHMNSSIRLIFIVRDPVVRMVSDYLETMSKKNDSNPPKFEKLALASNSGSLNLDYRALQTSLYQRHMKRWLQSFDRSQIHIVDGDVLIDDPATELRKVETFLGLKHQLTSEMFYRNESRGFYCIKNGHCLGKSKGRKHPAVSQKVLDKLCKFFRPHNQLFFQLIGQEFNWC